MHRVTKSCRHLKPLIRLKWLTSCSAWSLTIQAICPSTRRMSTAKPPKQEIDPALLLDQLDGLWEISEHRKWGDSRDSAYPTSTSRPNNPTNPSSPTNPNTDYNPNKPVEAFEADAESMQNLHFESLHAHEHVCEVNSSGSASRSSNDSSGGGGSGTINTAVDNEDANGTLKKKNKSLVEPYASQHKIRLSHSPYLYYTLNERLRPFYRCVCADAAHITNI